MGGAGLSRPKALRKTLGALTTVRGGFSLSRAGSAASSASAASASASATALPSDGSFRSDATAGDPPERVAAAGALPRGGLLFQAPADDALAERQKGAIRFLAGKLGGQLLSGSVSLKSTTMPVHLNEARSFLGRLTDDFAFARGLLGAAAGGAAGEGDGCLQALRGVEGVEAAGGVDPARRLALVAAYLVSGLHLSASMAKSYNPQIGETYKAGFGPVGEKTWVYLEQSRHHPPVSHYTATPPSRTYILSGYAGFDTTFRIAESALFTRRTGVTTIDFGGDPSDRIVFYHPTVVIRGIISGERKVDVTGPCSLFYEKYGLVMDLLFDPLTVSGSSTPMSAVSAVSSVISNPFGMFTSSSSSERTQESIEASARDNCADAVRGVMYQLLPGSATSFSGAFAATDDAFFGDPDSVAADVLSGVRGPAIELRCDKETTASVSAAWGCSVAETGICPTHSERASPENIERRIVALCSGSWLSHLDVGGERVWDLASVRDKVAPDSIEKALPSDARHRRDVAALVEALRMTESKERDTRLDEAQDIKEEMEREVRAEAKLRPLPELATDHFLPRCLSSVPK